MIKQYLKQCKKFEQKRILQSPTHALKVTPFWLEHPHLWFAQLECQMQLNNITAEATKYYSVCANLHCKYASEMVDIIVKSATGKY